MIYTTAIYREYTVQDRLNIHDDKVLKSDNKFSDFVHYAIMRLKTEVKTIKHSMSSKSLDVALCKSRLDVVDKNMADVTIKLRHIPIKNSNVHQSGQHSYRNENQQSTPTYVSGNSNLAQIPSPGLLVVDILSCAVTQPKTDVRWSRVNHTENDTSAIPQTVSISQIQIGHALDYFNNCEEDSGENVSFPGIRDIWKRYTYSYSYS